MARNDNVCPAFLSVARAIAAATNLPAILQLITEHTVYLTHAKACSISLLDPTARVLKMEAAFGLSSEFVERPPVSVENDSIASEVLRGTIISVPSISSDSRVDDPMALSELDIASFVMVEIVVGERPLGVMTIYKTTEGEFAPEDMDVILTMASFGAVGIESGRAYDRLYRRCADLGVMNQVAEDINVSLRTDEVIDAIVKKIPLVLHGKACSLRLFEAKTNEIVPVRSHGLEKGLLETKPIRLEDSPLDQIALKGEIVTVGDVPNDPRWRYPERAHEEGILSVIVAPMIIKGKPVGTIWMYAGEPRIFSEEERALLRAIARHSAIAIENARLYELTVRSHDQIVQDVWEKLPDVWGSIAGRRHAA